MGEVGIIGLDLAKNVFQAHGAGVDGSVVFRRKLSRAQRLEFVGRQPRCVVAMEACASAHHWGRAIGDLGHEGRLIPPAYVRPFVKRQKTEGAEAQAIGSGPRRAQDSGSWRSKGGTARGPIPADPIAVEVETIADRDRTLRAAAAKGEAAAWVQTMPGIGPVAARAVEAFAPPRETLR